jgi:hypothetical protein
VCRCSLTLRQGTLSYPEFRLVRLRNPRLPHGRRERGARARLRLGCVPVIACSTIEGFAESHWTKRLHEQAAGAPVTLLYDELGDLFDSLVAEGRNGPACRDLRRPRVTRSGHPVTRMPDVI